MKHSRTYLRLAVVATLLIGMAPILRAQEEDEEPPPAEPQPSIFYTNEIRLPIVLEGRGDVIRGLGGGIEYNRYPGSRIHDDHHRTRFAEAVGRPSSSIHLAFNYGPNFELGVENRGYAVAAGGTKLFGGTALGAIGRYSRSTLHGSDHDVTDYEAGPQFELWPLERLYLREQALFRMVGAYHNPDVPFAFSEEVFVQIRHHLTYVVGEEWDFTYSHDVALSVGTDQNAHTNTLSMDNFFLFSPSTRLSYGPIVGFRLKYTVGNRTSVLTLPVRGRFEYFIPNLGLVYGELGYDIPTMEGREGGKILFVGSFSYRF